MLARTNASVVYEIATVVANSPDRRLERKWAEYKERKESDAISLENCGGCGRPKRVILVAWLASMVFSPSFCSLVVSLLRSYSRSFNIYPEKKRWKNAFIGFFITTSIKGCEKGGNAGLRSSYY